MPQSTTRLTLTAAIALSALLLPRIPAAAEPPVAADAIDPSETPAQAKTEKSEKAAKNLSAALPRLQPAPKPRRADPQSLPEAFGRPVPSSPQDLATLEVHVQAMAERLHPTTIAIETDNATGSGVIVSPNGFILTAGHVFEHPGRSVRVRFPDGSLARGVSLGLIESLDAGVCMITDPPPEGGWPHAPVGDLDHTRPGSYVLAIGHPNGFDPERPFVVRLGRVIARRPTVLQTDATVVGGDSGGPLFDMHGRVIGIHSRISSSLNGNFHIPIHVYLDHWETLVNTDAGPPNPGNRRRAARSSDNGSGEGHPSGGKPTLGIEGRNNPNGIGTLVDRVLPDSPAARAGLRPGDTILTLDGKPVRSFAELRLHLARSSAGQKVRLGVRRGDEPVRMIEAVLGRR